MNRPQRSQPPSLGPLSSNRSSTLIRMASTESVGSSGTRSPSGINFRPVPLRMRSPRSSLRSSVRPTLRTRPLASFRNATVRRPSSLNLPMSPRSFMNPVANLFEEPDVLRIKEVQHDRAKMLVCQCHNQEKCMHASLSFCKNYFGAHLLLCHVTMPNYTVTSDPVEHRVVSTPSKRYEGRDDISITIPETEGRDSIRITREVRRFGIRRCIGVYVDMPRGTDMS